MDDAVLVTIINTVVLIGVLGSLVALVAGAVGNAMREKRGEPIKKRTRMIVLELLVIGLCMVIYKSMQ
jgi:hypothetical protein